jgi:hypothetical protein
MNNETISIKKGGTKPLVHLLPMMALLVLGMISLVGVVSANYSYDGSSLVEATHGSCNGDLWVSAGDHSGLPSSNQSYTSQTYVTNYSTLPSFSSVEWAHLYVGVWGGTAARRGYANTSLIYNNNVIFYDNAHIYDGTAQDNIKGVGAGTWVVDYDVTNEINNISLSGQTLTASVYTTNEPGYTFDGRVYGVTLVVAYNINGSTRLVTYQVNDGLVNLNNPNQLNTERTQFDDVSYSSDEATVTLVQLAGNAGQPDYAFFNPSDVAGSPYRSDVIRWTLPNYLDSQLDSADVADASEGSNYDLDTFTEANDGTSLKDRVNTAGSNYIVFKRGYDSNNNGVIDASYYDTTKEGESYVSPIIAIVKLTRP